jgi:hypothetical protein
LYGAISWSCVGETLAGLANSALPVQDCSTRTELKYVPTVDVAELRQEIDRLSKAYRELDATIQAENWTVDMAEPL